jgi:thymidylate synthase
MNLWQEKFNNFNLLLYRMTTRKVPFKKCATELFHSLLVRSEAKTFQDNVEKFQTMWREQASAQCWFKKKKITKIFIISFNDKNPTP